MKNRIKYLREQRGLSQVQLGELLNVKDAAISKYENGKIPLTDDTINRLCDIFNVSSDYLLCRNTAKEENEKSHFINSYIDDAASGKSISYWTGKSGIGIDDLAKELGISKKSVSDIMKGLEPPSYEILRALSDICGVSTDCLLGFNKKSRSADLDGILPFEYNTSISKRIKELCKQYEEMTGSAEYSFLENMLSMDSNEIYNMIEYGFIPHLDTLIKLSEYFNVSCDYLLCLCDERTEKVRKTFELLDDDNKDIYLGSIKRELRQQQYESSVAADEDDLREPLKKVK